MIGIQILPVLSVFKIVSTVHVALPKLPINYGNYEADNRQEEHTVIIYVLWTLRYIPILLHGPPLCLTHAYSEMHKRTYSLLLLRYLTYLFPCPRFCTNMEQNWTVFRPRTRCFLDAKYFITRRPSGSTNQIDPYCIVSTSELIEWQWQWFWGSRDLVQDLRSLKHWLLQN